MRRCSIVAPVLVVVLAACGCAKRTTAPTPEPTEQAFHEDFNPTSDGKIDSTKWNLSLGDGAAGLTGGTLTLENYGTGDFPYLTSKVNPFPTEGLPSWLRAASAQTWHKQPLARVRPAPVGSAQPVEAAKPRRLRVAS